MASNVGRGDLLTRGALATRTDCNIETIRYYEQVGLLPSPPRSQGGHRLYGETLIKRLIFIRRSRDLGFTIEEIRGLLRLVDGGKYTCAEVEELAMDHVREIRRKIADLKKLKDVLEAMALALFGRRPHQRVDRPLTPATKNLHKSGHSIAPSASEWDNWSGSPKSRTRPDFGTAVIRDLDYDFARPVRLYRSDVLEVKNWDGKEDDVSLKGCPGTSTLTAPQSIP